MQECMHVQASCFTMPVWTPAAAGWFTDPTPFCQGGLSTEEVQAELNAAISGAISAMQGEFISQHLELKEARLCPL
jgi:hypothetical protein